MTDNTKIEIPIEKIVKKKRGRPKKNTTANETNLEKSNHPNNTETETTATTATTTTATVANTVSGTATATATATATTTEVKIPKKRGRKPKPKSLVQEEPKVYKKRGRKPKPKNPDEEKKIPKKRGRKPKNKYNIVENTHIIPVNKEESIILHLPINTDNIKNKEYVENQILKYNPNVSEPQPCDPNDLINHMSLPSEFKSIPRNIDNDNTDIDTDYELDSIEQNIKIDINDIETTTKENHSYQIHQSSNINEFQTTDEKDSKETENEINKDKYESILENFSNKRNLDISNCANQIGKSKLIPIFLEYKDSNKTKKWPSKTNIDCLWDCHPFDTQPYGLPMKRDKNVFYMFGNFCSPQCAAAYNFDCNDDSDEIWERYSLLNCLYGKQEDTKAIKIALPKLILNKFGGKLNINEYRKCNRDFSKSYKLVMPPMISLIPSLEEVNIDVNQGTGLGLNKEKSRKIDEEFKLRRSKPLPDYHNTLENCMSLKYL